jgi:arginyl-tRNA synthetase
VITAKLVELVRIALDSAEKDGVIQFDGRPEVFFERPRRAEFGDWATNVALVAGRAGNPREAAELIRARLPASDLVERVEVAGPGFLNFHLSPVWLHDVVRRAADASGGFGRSTREPAPKFNVEYVSANPTGAINVVSGRHAAVGDAIANLLAATGHEVVREFYINDAGRQVELFGASVAARYLQVLGKEAPLPEGGYLGEDLVAVARRIAQEHGDEFVEVEPEERNKAIRDLALAQMRAQMKTTLERFGTTFDVWFSEVEQLHSRGAVEAIVRVLREKGVTDEREGALWFKSSAFGDDKDRVLVRANGRPTYLASDAAYLADKFGRNFEHLIYLWGSDHHGTVARVRGLADALGPGRDRVEIRLVQIVTLKRGGEIVKGSKRAGVVEPLDELMDEVGADAARYTFLTHSIDAPLDFDIDLAKEKAPENPVYYVQYAHARICSILRKAEEQGAVADPATAPLDRLSHPSEIELMRKLAAYEEMVPLAAELRAPQRVTAYVEQLAAVFSAFYRDCRVVSEDADLTRARLALCLATKSVVADGLGLLGVSAPERM